MLTKVRYTRKDMFYWTRWEVLFLFLFSGAVAFAYVQLGFTFLHLPWTPIAVIGTAVAFIISFQNNAAYGRIWEARKIWGGIVNTSRAFGMKIQVMITNEYASEKMTEDGLDAEKKEIIYRHIAWLTALRHAMRKNKPWEVFMQHVTNRDWAKLVHIPEFESTVEEDLKDYLSEEDQAYVLSKSNKSTALLYLQSRHLKRLKEKGVIWEFSFLELENALEELFSLQGKSERIKNFPYPRQYASLSYYFVQIFILFLPFAVIPEFSQIGVQMVDSFPLWGSYFVWMGVPFCVIISWVFYTMERIGRAGENPFEGTANDVPISAISRGIEIDLRQMLDEGPDQIPNPFPEVFNVQM